MTLTARDVRRLLEELDLRPSTSLGQNFVADPNTVRRVARLAGVGPGSLVVEVGPGLGSLTLALVEAGARIVAVEIDPRLAEATRRAVGDAPVEVVTADALTLDWVSLLGEQPASGSWSLVANLPYNVAVPLVVQVLEQAPMIESMTVMVQREVGERLVARPGDEGYGAVSVKVDYWATGKVLGRVPPSVFVPRPKVDSVLVRLDRRARPAVDPAVVGYGRLFDVVRAGFAHRRKMLRGALAGLVDQRAFEASGVAPQARAEELDLSSWAVLARSDAP